MTYVNSVARGVRFRREQAIDVMPTGDWLRFGAPVAIVGVFRRSCAGSDWVAITAARREAGSLGKPHLVFRTASASNA